MSQDDVTNNTDKYFDHRIDCHNENNNNYKYEPFNSGQHQQKLLSIRHHLHHPRSADNHNIYFAHLNDHEMDIKYNPPPLELQNINRSDINSKKRSKSVNKCTADVTTEEDDSGIVDCEREEIHCKRKRKYIFSLDYDDIEIKMESGSESEIRNIDLPLRTKSY